ncbi:MAG TPA: SDR family NAD(P)-dependent oxidoreductase, partial [Gammaproteobacteria bacterium]|nr:SDR family NAD(P)-dependent oxidoreductase [Gammaproteobacteria bacterium]
MLLKDKVAVITGSASGIGKRMAEVFAAQGAKVVIADLVLSAADATAKEIQAKKGTAMAIGMDVTNEDQVESGIAEVISAYGGVDILVSNAGIQYISPVEELPFSEWKKMLAIQLDGAFLTTKACLKNMYQRGKGGSIIYTGSVHSKEASKL